MQINHIINSNNKFTNKNYSNFDHSMNLPRHRWYYFKEGFSPLMVEEAINFAEMVKDDLVIDPFSGSGTVPLMASSLNFKSIGFEVNPFMAFVANTKQFIGKFNNFEVYTEIICRGIKKGAKSNLEGYSTFSENSKNNKWLFNRDVLRAFEGGWQATEELADKTKKLFRLGLLVAVMKNANAAKDGKCLRYKKDWQTLSYSKETFTEVFLENMALIYSDIQENHLKVRGKINSGDVRKKINVAFENKFKLCITSPPYLNSFDYSDIYRPELFLGKFINNNQELSSLRRKTIRSHVQIDWEKPLKSDFGFLYSNCINEIIIRKDILWNKNIPLMIQAYFEDMENILTLLKQKAKRNAILWFVVSTSAYAGVEIPVDLIIADIGAKIGWNLKEVAVIRYLRNSTQNANRWNNGEASTKKLRESIIIFKGVD